MEEDFFEGLHFDILYALHFNIDIELFIIFNYG
jgi:hypothetical protein